ncbi:MAG TPA: amidohydrolase family protein, partial [Planctomycetaceae bacterium]
SDAYDRAFTIPKELRKAGVRFCISGANRFGSSNARNLPYHAATASAFGLPPEEALKAITLYPAQIVGVSDRVGSLEPGKDATLFVATGDPLEAATQVTAAYVRGRKVDLTDRHKQLYEKYRTKYDRQNGK